MIDITVKSFGWRPLENSFDLVIPKSVKNFMTGLIFLLAFFGIVAYVFDQKITSLLATSGMFVMIVGLAIQMNISNIFSGVAMALEQPFQPGDWIKVSDFDEGEVVDISWRTTKILTKDNSILSFPNSTVSEGQIKNYNSPTSVTRRTILVKIDPLHRPKDVEKILLDACLACSNTLLSDEPYAKLHHIDDWFAQYKLSYSISDFQNRGIISRRYGKTYGRIWIMPT